MAMLEIIDAMDQRQDILEQLIRRNVKIWNKVENETARELYQSIVEAFYQSRMTNAERRRFLEENARFQANHRRNRESAENMRRYRARRKARQETVENYDLEIEKFLGIPSAIVEATEDDGPIELEQQNTRPAYNKPETLEQMVEPKPRNPMLDQINLDMIYERLKYLQERRPEDPASISDIAEFYRKGGAPEEEVEEKATFWVGELTRLGLAEPGKYRGELRILEK